MEAQGHREDRRTARARLARFGTWTTRWKRTRRIFASDTRWTVVRGSDLEEGESQGLPVWRRHVGDPILESNLTRRVDFALFMVEALKNDELVHEAPAIVGRLAPSVLARELASWLTRSHPHPLAMRLGVEPGRRGPALRSCLPVPPRTRTHARANPTPAE